MTTESLEEHRQRLLRDENVQEMIRARAFEIYHMRGVQPGAAAEDWFQAESEVLAFLLAHHPEQVIEEQVEQIAATPVADALSEPATPKKRKPRSTSKQTAAKKAPTKRTGPKKALVSDSKPKRARKESKSEDKTT
jgi:DNA-binding SARP family transcriptional activator